jgi:hypothetical protein
MLFAIRIEAAVCIVERSILGLESEDKPCPGWIVSYLEGFVHV